MNDPLARAAQITAAREHWDELEHPDRHRAWLESQAAAGDPEPIVRLAALAFSCRVAPERPETRSSWRECSRDPDATVRRRAAELGTDVRIAHIADLTALLDDDDPLVVEMTAWALGERGDKARSATPALVEIVTHHVDPLAREAAAAALGAIGDDRAKPALLDAAGNDKPAVRRRAILALAPFDGDDVVATWQAAIHDRDWQVRQAAEALLEVDRRGAIPES